MIVQLLSQLGRCVTNGMIIVLHEPFTCATINAVDTHRRSSPPDLIYGSSKAGRLYIDLGIVTKMHVAFNVRRRCMVPLFKLAYLQ